ncbi:MAG: anaerobic sulfatase maturase [Syntrophobacteraceae bacterium]|nr:anaerobic sulfatase maturase [Syntrophobacteraceae bacterium]
MKGPAVTKASREFQIFVKPAGATCNLDCHYCYYLPKEGLYPGAKPFQMQADLLEQYIVQQIEISPEPVISFFWHGGEPTLLGLDFFRKIVELQRKHIPPGRRITNSLQTNGVILNEEWCRFFAAEGFSVGLSLDGPQALHDRYRVTKDQRPTHKQVMQGYRLLRQHKIPVDILCVVHAENVRYPLQVYRFFKDIKTQYISFIPLVELRPPPDSGVGLRTVPADGFGAFLCAIFDEWVRQDIGRIMVQIFEEAARPAYGQDHSLCIFRLTCGDVPVIEHNGDFFSCDHFVTPEHRLGNIHETPLLALLESPAQRSFGRAKLDQLPGYCRECAVLSMCNGGCPKDRILQTSDGEIGLNYLCAGYKRFFEHCRPYMARLAALRRAGHPPERLMKMVQAEDAKGGPKAGRNDPCPCGSGRKYKKCCLNA